MSNRAGAQQYRPGLLEKLAAGVLFVMALPIGWWSIVIAAEGLSHGPGSGGVLEAMVGLGVLLGLIAALHIGGAVQTWTGRDRMLGLIVGTVGSIAGAVGLWVSMGAIGGGGPLNEMDVALIMLPVPYLIVLLLLLRARRRSREVQRPIPT